MWLVSLTSDRATVAISAAMADEQVVKQLVDRLSSEEAAAQEATAEEIK